MNHLSLFVVGGGHIFVGYIAVLSELIKSRVEVLCTGEKMKRTIQTIPNLILTRKPSLSTAAMEKAVSEGKLKSIELSNYYEPEDFDRLVNATSIKPALLQNETHPYHQSKEMQSNIAQYGTVLESWFPLGGRGNTQTIFNDPTISSIAAAHGKTSAQIILRWHLQAGNIAIPGSSNPDHIQENCEIFDFELSADEMAQLTAIDKNERFADY